MNATRAISIRLKSFGYDGPWTAGRVQTPTLTMLVDRELAIYAHRPKPFWTISATFDAAGQRYDAKWVNPAGGKDSDRLYEGDAAKALFARIQNATGWTVSDDRSEKTVRPPLLFDLTGLQKTANKLLGFSAKRSLDAAQRLYEKYKLISYPRTDSRFLPTDYKSRALDAAAELVSHQITADAAAEIQRLGPKNLGRIFNDAKVTDHFAIVPLRAPQHPLSGDDSKIYDLIARQFIAALMGPARWAHVKRITRAEDLQFVCSGRVLEEPGFELAFGRQRGHGSPLAELPSPSGTAAQYCEGELEEKETKPPSRLSEAGLLSKMETCGREIDDEELAEAMSGRGLGTPATRAETIEKLIARQYLAREGKALRATAKAIRMIDILRGIGVETLTSVELTGALEHRLAQVEAGSLSRADFMDDIRGQTETLTERLRSFNFDDLYGESQNLGHLPGVPDAVVRETPWGYEAAGDDPFFLWKDIRGHVLQSDCVRTLLNDTSAHYGPIPLYTPSSGGRTRSFQAEIKLKRLSDEAYAALPQRGKRVSSRWQIEILGDNSASAEPAVEETVIGSLCKAKNGHAIVETEIRYADRHALAGERGGLTLAKEVCKRRISADEAKQYFETGATEMLSDFISKRGRPFRAKLVLKDNGRHKFEFEPRKPRPKKAVKTAVAKEA
jgi:DNA topoisomerase-3